MCNNRIYIMRTIIENALRDGFFPDAKLDINFIIDYFEQRILEDEYIDNNDEEAIDTEVHLYMPAYINKDILKRGDDIQKQIYYVYQEDYKSTIKLLYDNHKAILKANRLNK